MKLKVKHLLLAGGHSRTVRKAKLAPGVKEVPNPKQAWRLQ